MAKNNSLDKTGASAPGTREPMSLSRRLVAWPMALVALTLALLLMANTVSAWGRRDNHDVADFKDHAEFFVGRMLGKLDATAEQEERIQAIVADSVERLAAVHAEASNRGELHDEMAALMTAETIDPDAVEAIRASHLSRADAMSRIVSASLTDVMNELTVDQRKQLHERLSRHRGRRGWH